jgi:phosphatidyl-myo-inositol dimannoside synthase
MTPLRVLMITPDFPPQQGGIQRVAHRLATNFDAVTTRVLTIDAEGARQWDAGQDLDVHRVAAERVHRLAILRLDTAALVEARRFRPDVVLAMHIVAGPAAAVIRRALSIPVVTYLHAKEIAASPRLARFAIGHSDRIVAVSHYTTTLAAAAGADLDKVIVIPPGVDWHEPPTEQRLSTPTIVTVARIEDSYKGHDVMVRALPLVRARIPAARWAIVGDGALRVEIERLAEVQGVRDALSLYGAVSDQRRDQLLNRAHVFAMPSRLPPSGGGEGFGIVYLEAGVHALPVIAGRVGGALDAVVDGTTGLLVDPVDHGALAEALSRLLIDRRYAARMGAAGSEHARAFAWPTIAARVEQLLAETAVCA